MQKEVKKRKLQVKKVPKEWWNSVKERQTKDKLTKFFNFVENSWWNKKNNQYDNLKNNFV